MAVLLVLFLVIIGIGELVAGVYMLAGTGWALVALGIVTVACAAVVSRGIAHGG